MDAAAGPQRSRTTAYARQLGTAGRAALLPHILARPWAPLALLLLNAALALSRPPLGGMDTPALAAAWEIVRSGDWLMWQAAGGSAAETPPALPWIIALAWHLMGIGVAAPRLICALAMALALLAVRRLAERLWPQRADAGPLASWAFAGSAGVALLGAGVAPETLACAIVAGGLFGLTAAAEGRRVGWLLFGAALALALLAVGSLALWTLAVPAALAPAWASRRGGPGWIGWYALLLLACIIALLPLWWLAQTSSVWSWMAPQGEPGLLPLLALAVFFYPWPFWPRFWRSARRQSPLGADAGVRLCLAALLAPAIGLIVEGAGPERLLPLAPAACALIARLLAGRLPGRADFHAGIPALPLALMGALPIIVNTAPWAQLAGRARQLAGVELPIWVADLGVGGGMLLLGGTFLLIQGTPRLMLSRAAHIALLPAVLSAALAWEMAGAVGRSFDLRPMAARIAELQSREAPVALFGIDPSDYAFAGRLERPLPAFENQAEVLDWARQHPDGAVLAPFDGSVLHLPRQPNYAAPQGARWVALWPAGAIVETLGAVLSDGGG